MYAIATVDVSANTKIGPIPATWSTRNTCPPTCPMLTPPPGKKAEPCYWWTGYRTRVQAKNLEEKATAGTVEVSPAAFIRWVANLPLRSLWRDRVGGDQLPEKDNPERIDAEHLRKVHRANRKRKARAFGFSHYSARDPHNRELIIEGYRSGYVLNASANSIPEAVALKTDYPKLSVVALAPSTHKQKVTVDATTGLRAVLCPQTWNKDITCSRCGICAVPGRDYIIVFPSHGTGKRAADLIAVSA